MNIRDLKIILNQYPETLDVHVLCEGYGNEFPADRADIRLEPVTDIDGNPKVVLLIGKQ